MLTPQDLVLLREALAYWAKECCWLGLHSAKWPTLNLNAHVEVTEADIQELLQQLLPENVRYIVVDGETNHAINTRLFRKVPRLHPCSERWQVRTVIG